MPNCNIVKYPLFTEQYVLCLLKSYAYCRFTVILKMFPEELLFKEKQNKTVQFAEFVPIVCGVRSHLYSLKYNRAFLEDDQAIQ